MSNPCIEHLKKNAFKPALLILVTILVITLYFVYRDYVINDQSATIDALALRIEKQAVSIADMKDRLRFKDFTITLGDSTLQALTELNIEGTPYRYLHTKSIDVGRNEFYFVLRDGMSVEMIINKYR